MMRKMVCLATVPLLLAGCGSENGTTGPEPFGHITGVVHLEMCDLNPSWVRLCAELGFGVSGTIDGRQHRGHGPRQRRRLLRGERTTRAATSSKCRPARTRCLRP